MNSKFEIFQSIIEMQISIDSIYSYLNVVQFTIIQGKNLLFENLLNNCKVFTIYTFCLFHNSVIQGVVSLICVKN